MAQSEKDSPQWNAGKWLYLEMATELWRRISVALSPLVFCFIAIGFGTVRTRAVRAGAALVATVVTLATWALQLLGTSIAHAGMIPPSLAMLIPIFVGLGVAIFSFRKATW